MLKIETPSDLAAQVGRELGVSEWLVVDQPMIDAFAGATGDRQWIHTDIERAARELEGGTTIAHGYLILSLIPRLSTQIYTILRRSRSVNYGSNKVRFTSMVLSGSSIRLRQRVKAVEAIQGGVRLFMESIIEIEGQERPALVAETISLIYD
ncbi:MAG: MaoC family dehydratase [Beijerinckiaceae bacterium]|jgi:acyl dehydratase|nr:MaoC family dehydratase [Beijerinckiaceae bacterium]